MSHAAEELTLATCQADNTVPISRALADYLSARLARLRHLTLELLFFLQEQVPFSVKA